MTRHVLMMDTATDVTVVALVKVHHVFVELLDAAEREARRAAMSQLFPAIVSMVERQGLPLSEIDECVVGRGPGSFTGVRIGVAAAKGLAQGLRAPLFGIGTLDTVAWRFAGHEGLVGVVGDAMRGEVYPALFRAEEGRVERLGVDLVAHPDDAARQWAALGEPIVLSGNGLRKHAAAFAGAIPEATMAPDELWDPSAAGMMAAYADARGREALGTGDPGTLLPVYTRLSDAEEAEQRRITGATPPETGVIGADPGGPR